MIKNVFIYIWEYLITVKTIYYLLILSIVIGLYLLFIIQKKWEYRHNTTKIVAEAFIDDYIFLQKFAKNSNKNVYLCYASAVTANTYNCINDNNTSGSDSILAYYNEIENNEFNEYSNIIKVMNYPKDINLIFSSAPFTIYKDKSNNNNIIKITPDVINPEQSIYHVEIINGEANTCNPEEKECHLNY